MWHSLRTVLFFVVWGLLLGGGLGTLAGTLILPFFGTVYAAIWGTGMGASLGFVTGLLVTFVNMAVFSPDLNLQTYRRRLSAGAGVLNAIGAMLLLLITTQGFLWNYYPVTGIFSPTYFSPLLVLIMAAGAVGSGLASAYTASRFADWYPALMMKRKNEDIATQQPAMTESQSFREYMRIAYRFSRAPMLLAAVFTTGLALVSPRNTLFQWFSAGLGGMLYVFVLTTLLGLLNATLMTFLNRLFFKEYFPHQPPAKYKVSLMVLMFMVTLLSSLALTGGFLAPVAAGGAALIAGMYADWYSGASGTNKVLKRDAAAHQAAIQRLSDERSGTPSVLSEAFVRAARESEAI